MDSKIVSADEGWYWFVRGWRLFLKNPGIMVGQTVVLLIIAIVANLVPLAGGLAMALVTPVLAGGWYYSIRQLDNDAQITIGDIFEGFRNKRWTGPLIVLGAIILATQFIVFLIVAGLLGTGFLQEISAYQAGVANLALGFGGLLSLALILLLAAVLCAALFYAIPLVIFRQASPVAALQDSFRATMRNWKPVSVFGLIYLVAALAAAIPLGLGFLVLIPVSLCAAFDSYKGVFE